MPGGRPRKEKRAVRKVIAEAILASVDELAIWQELLTASTPTSVRILNASEDDPQYETISVPDYQTRFKAISYLTNRRDGMPAQTTQETGSLKVVVEYIGTAAPHKAAAKAG